MTIHHPHRSRRHAVPAVAVGAALLVAGSSAAPTGHQPTDLGAAKPQTISQQAATEACPEPFPVEELQEDMKVTGLTVEQGTEPDPFDGTVVGVIENGIGPDVDMIIVETSSPAIERAGGIWSGMSGSPVYTPDGRLIGAVAYGLSLSPSPIAGITPAADMKDLLERPAAAAAKPATSKNEIDLPTDVQRRLVASGTLSSADARAGMSRLALPLAVSGVSADRLDELSSRLDERSLNVRAFPAGAADTPADGDPSDIFPGSNAAAGVSYGDVTTAAVGTTTMVCDDQAVAFGHPFQWTGPAALSLHSASAVLVQRDDAMGSFKVANPQGIVGTVDQDRQAGIVGRLGQEPLSTPITTSVTADDDARSGTTNVTTPIFLPDTAVLHLWTNIDTVLDRIGAGTADLSWTITGARASGEPFEVAVQNTYASQDDIAYEAAFDSYEQLSSILNNEHEEVTITGVDYTADLSGDFTRLTVSKLEIKRPDGTYETPSESEPRRVPAGSELTLRVTLKPYKNVGEPTSVELAVKVPENAAGRFGWVDVIGGRGDDAGVEESEDETTDDATDDAGEGETGDGPAAAAGFDQLLDDLRNLTPNNSVNASLTFDDSDDGEPAASTRKSVDDVVSGSRAFPVEVVKAASAAE